MQPRGAPFVDARFRNALEHTDCIGPGTGWHPVSGMDAPAFLKTHSQGEFVFDWMWAQAAERAGIRWYPKLLIAAPFSPVVGPRLSLTERTAQSVSNCLMDLERFAEDHRLSNAGINFCDDLDREILTDSRWLERMDWQFHWQNQGYTDFDGFLCTLKRRARKNILAERRKAATQGWVCRWLTGSEISDELITLAYQCYEGTHQLYGNHAPLNRAFFELLFAQMDEQTLMCVASIEGQDLACAIFLRDQHRLYGRYWGSLVDTRDIHFEVCYYQGIQYCIDHRLDCFEPGAQGEHKIRRGFLPVMTYSYHWFSDKNLQLAVRDYLNREHQAILAYRQQLEALNPYAT